MLDEGLTLYCSLTLTVMYPQERTSTVVHSIDVNPLTGYAKVELLSGDVYEYFNVSRRACANLLAQPNMSLGFWFNKNCKAKGIVCKQIKSPNLSKKWAKFKSTYAHN